MYAYWCLQHRICLAVINLKFVPLIRQEFENYKELLFKKRQGKNVLLSDPFPRDLSKRSWEMESPLCLPSLQWSTGSCSSQRQQTVGSKWWPWLPAFAVVMSFRSSIWRNETSSVCSVRGTRFLQLVPVTVEQNHQKPQSEILLCMSLTEKAGV